MFWHCWGYINTIHCCFAFWVLQKKKRKTGYVYAFGIFSFCVYFLYASFQHNHLIISKHYFHFASSGDFGTMDAQQQRKMLGEHGTYIICYVQFYIILYIPTTHSQFFYCISSSFHSCWCVEMMAYFLFTYYCKWGGHTLFHGSFIHVLGSRYHFGVRILMWTWVPLCWHRHHILMDSFCWHHILMDASLEDNLKKKLLPPILLVQKLVQGTIIGTVFKFTLISSFVFRLSARTANFQAHIPESQTFSVLRYVKP